MNIYEKIQKVKEEFLKRNVKKSGHNKFANYNYYELADITPPLIELCNSVKLFTKFSYDNIEAKLVVVNTEKPEEFEIYTSPMKELELKGCNEIQALGGVETYQRRYLYMSAFDIIENDMFDSTVADPKTKEDEKAKLQEFIAETKNKVNNINIIDKAIDDEVIEKTGLFKKYRINNTEDLTYEQTEEIIKIINERTK